MDIYTTLKLNIQNSSQEEVVKQLDYNSIKKGLSSLNSFISYDNLYSWLHSGFYDFKFTPIELFKNLCIIYNIDKESVENELKKLQDLQLQLNLYKNCYIYINTNFKRTTQPIFVLAFAESLRQIKIDAEDLVYKSKKEILNNISKIVQEHYKQKNGKLEVWGDIQNYIYHHIKDEKYIFGKDGNILENIDINETKAIVNIGKSRK